MRTLILMRHAKSDWGNVNLSDHDRPLNARGMRAAPLMAQHLLANRVRADVILASSAVRVQQTLELLQENWGGSATVWKVPELYLAGPQEIVRHIEGLHDDWQNAMVIGHNPGLSALASHLAGDCLDMPTAATILFTTQQSSWLHSIRPGNWTLQAFWRPRDLEI
jgi:phosphohistidine phosphatase